MSQREKRVKQAASWLICLLTTEDITPELWGQFERWLAKYPDNKREYLAIQTAWDYVGQLVRRADQRYPNVH